MLLVHDEYGHFEGIVTPNDLLSAIAGEFASDQTDGAAPSVIEREDGSLLIGGAMAADSMAERLAWIFYILVYFFGNHKISFTVLTLFFLVTRNTLSA